MNEDVLGILMPPRRRPPPAAGAHGLAWATLGRKEVFADPPWIRIRSDRVRLPTGQTVNNFYHVEFPQHVVVLAITRGQRLVMVRQYKHALGRVVLGFPAGFLDGQEAPLAAAKRELREETGHVSRRWTSLGRFVVDGNHGCGAAHFFFAEGARAVAKPGDDAHEPLAIDLLRPAEVRRAFEAGEIAVLSHALAYAFAFGKPPRPGPP